jgi:hypothetical protein
VSTRARRTGVPRLSQLSKTIMGFSTSTPQYNGSITRGRVVIGEGPRHSFASCIIITFERPMAVNNTPRLGRQLNAKSIQMATAGV